MLIYGSSYLWCGDFRCRCNFKLSTLKYSYPSFWQTKPTLLLPHLQVKWSAVSNSWWYCIHFLCHTDWHIKKLLATNKGFMVQVLNISSWCPDISRYRNLFESTPLCICRFCTRNQVLTKKTFGIPKFQASGIHLHKWVSTNTCKSHLLAN